MQDQNTRETILEAAAARFTHYGYGKTTIAEIAADCDMSVGNIYRHFENKEAIAMAGVERKMREKAEVCESACDATASAFEQLKQYMLARLRYTYQMSCNSVHMFELVELITQKHGNLIQKFDERAIGWFAKILQRGVENGEFRTMDVQREAGSILMATVIFCIPIFMQEPLPVMEARLDDLMELLHHGLKS
jgi:AcrR family transcriptional regulator